MTGWNRISAIGSLLALFLVAGCADKGGPLVDTTPPAGVLDLKAVPGSTMGAIDLTWTAVGDDGNSGRASAYVVKYATSAIDESNFCSRLTYTQNWAPLAAGMSERHTIAGLQPGEVFFVVIQVLDELSNPSRLSNEACAETFDPDTVPPERILDLAASLGSLPGEVDLTWTAPGDDHSLIGVESYELRYSALAITETNFQGATLYPQAWEPLPAGCVERKTLTGLPAETLVYFAVRSRDRASNHSLISNVASVTLPDMTPPSAVSDLVASPGLSPGAVRLAWTASGDDGSSGCAASYELRYSTSTITETNFSSATLHPQAWAPLPAGGAESKTVTGLPPLTLHYFAIKVRDEAPNVSPLSNVASATPPPDLFPPSATTDLSAVAGSTPGTIHLTWTAPGDDGNSGCATAYEVRYSTSPISASNYTTATVYPQAWSPRPAGNTEWKSLTGLTSAPVCYIAIKAIDDVSNTSALSNVASAQAPGSCKWWCQWMFLVEKVWGTSASDVFAVGDSGRILHFDGSAWSPMASGTTYRLRCVWGLSSSDVWAVGNNGTVLHFDGSSWTVMSTPTTDTLWDVWGSSPNDVWAVGNWGAMIHYNGTAWQAVNSGTSLHLYGMCGFATNNIYVAGQNNIVMRYNGASWSVIPRNWNNSWTNLIDIWGTSPTDIYAVGGAGSIVHFNGSTWYSMAVSTGYALFSVWGSAPNDYFAVDYYGAILHYNGSSWSPMNSGTTDVLWTVWGTSGSNVYAAGEGGQILHFNGSVWSNVQGWTPQNLYGVWGSSSSDVFTVGAGGTILHCDGAAWSAQASGTNAGLYTVWGASATDVFAAGDSGTLLRYNGSTWSASSTGTVQHIFGLWGFSGSDVFAVGTNGTVLRFDGTSWTPMSTGTLTHLNGVWGSSPNDVFAVGSGGGIMHYDGTSWTSMNSGTGQPLFSVWGTSANDVFAVGAYETILHYDGTAWTTQRSGGTDHFLGVWGLAPGDVFAVGTRTKILHFDGSGWSVKRGGSTSWGLSAVWGSSGADIFAVGDDGRTFHFK